VGVVGQSPQGPVPLWAPAGISDAAPHVQILRVTERQDLHHTVRAQHALLVAGEVSPEMARGFGAVLARGDGSPPSCAVPVVQLPVALSYLGEDDVVRVDGKRGRVDTLFRRWSKHNTLLLTERCNSYCVMCSQPPKAEDDGYLADELLEAIPLFHPDAEEVGFTGGEPTLLGGPCACEPSRRTQAPAARLRRSALRGQRDRP